MPKNTRMMRKNEGKPPLSFILDFPTALREMAFVMLQGADKYDKHNWKKGGPITELEDCLLRHLLDYHNCENEDKESKHHHLAHVMINAAFIIETEVMHGDEFDDRDWEFSYVKNT